MSVSEQILKIRKSAGNLCYQCPICGRDADNPYRRILDGEIVEGCVDATHTPYLQRLNTNSKNWHNRPEAKKIRKDLLVHLRSI